jgi:hypothetical protein
MFSTQEVVSAVKNLTIADCGLDDLSHCQLLEAKARKLGFESFHHLRTWLSSTPSDRIGNYSLALMRKICAMRLPTLQCSYYEFMILPNNGVGYYSCWIGWDRCGEEVRVPRPLAGLSTVYGLRKIAEHPIHVVESVKELGAWRYNWLSTALVPEELAKSNFPMAFNKQMLVEQSPTLDKIRSSGYQSNIVRD